MIRTMMMAALALTGGSPRFDTARPLIAHGRPLGGPSVVILWASWCVSCRAELARLPQLAASAAPLPIETLALDPADRALALLHERRQPVANAYADDRPPRTVLDEWGGPGEALPIAVAFNAQGHVCGRKLGLLGSDQLRQWAVRCSK